MDFPSRSALENGSKLRMDYADGDLRELDLETRVKTNEEKQVSEMSHSCALNK